MPWLSAILLDKAPPAPTDLKVAGVAISGHVLYYEATARQYWVKAPSSEELNDWTRYDGNGPRQAPVGHWVKP